MSSSIAYNQLTASIVSLAGLFSCFAGMAAQATTPLDRIIMFGSAISLLVASGFSWQNKNPMMAGALVCLAGILIAFRIATGHAYASVEVDQGQATMTTAMPM